MGIVFFSYVLMGFYFRLIICFCVFFWFGNILGLFNRFIASWRIFWNCFWGFQDYGVFLFRFSRICSLFLANL